MKIYVGNISFDTNDASLRSEFEKFGAVDEVTIISDRETGRSRGFAFVSMPDDNEARAAIEAINGKDIDGRTVNANEARPKKSFGGGGGGGGRNRDY